MDDFPSIEIINQKSQIKHYLYGWFLANQYNWI
jgi:hypothetical protein